MAYVQRAAEHAQDLLVQPLRIDTHRLVRQRCGLCLDAGLDDLFDELKH
jgi:hypothetical protein